DNEYAREEATADRKRAEEKVKALEDDLYDAESDILDELLPEAFAAVRESAKRNLRQRHYDEQLMGGIVLHQGKIAEMRTGEGKTLVATLPIYLNALTGKGCHLVTVNDYLSKRDAQWMGAVYYALGLSVSAVNGQKSQGSSGESFIYDPDYKSEGPEWERWPRMRPVTRKEAYLTDITYGTNNEFGFDYLRDNMVIDLSQCVQRGLNFAIVDEVDNILIDEARTPLIISGPAEEGSLKKYSVADGVARQLKGKVITDKEEQEAKFNHVDIEEGQDYLVNEKTQTVRLTDEGVQKAMHRLNINASDEFQAEWAHNVRQAIRAYELYKKNVQYVVKDGQVVIVDEFTGRLMFGRRYSEGLHQAIEAKETSAGERVHVKEESRTYATITFQNYFRMYKKLAGMTGTAATEAEEFSKIYKLDVVQIPTHRPMIRQDSSDFVFKDEDAKFKAVVKEVEEMHKEKRPILIGTVSVEKSEKLEGMLKRRGVEPKLLNAKNHEREADIIAEAGKPGAVMVATNMAGRGVDIILGGKEPEEPKRPETNDTEAIQAWELGHKNWEKQHDDWKARHEQVVDMGGLHVIGTERHEARRIDNQLRGRAGRQGDPGSSRFYVSLEDDVMRRFGGDRIRGVMERFGIGGEDMAIENSMVTSSIQSAQVKVEGYHFDMRKHLVEYDDVINTQRAVIYGERRKILSDADLKSNILSMIKEEITKVVASAFFEGSGEDEKEAMLAEIATIMPLPADINKETVADMKQAEIEEKLVASSEALYQAMEQAFTPEVMRKAE
ncbi:MAG TPA: preprotein translocase subunit SecA, partial [Dehalococcoidales bacterium]|nr:preprotein translocase subunit SecA [Dehalococcoidales bacterium]